MPMSSQQRPALPPVARLLAFCALGLAAAGVAAGVSKDLPLPQGAPTADQVAAQVYFANHFYAFKNFSINRKGRSMAVLISRDGPDSMTTAGVERHLNNNYPPGDSIAARDLAIFHSGKMKGTGILVTDFADDSMSQSYQVWLPELRKVRRFAEPPHQELWGGSVFTFGDVTLRKPEHETHELLGTKTFRSCLGVITALENQEVSHAGRLPERACRHVGKEVYGLKSTTKFPNWWYDYRISFVDTKSFADYRTAYYKNDELIKVIDRDWGVVSGSGKSDPRALFWKYWYGVDLVSGRESWAVIPQEVVEFDSQRDNNFWTEGTLTKLN
jgi:hypothetical protein